jgi:hypothetical protein
MDSLFQEMKAFLKESPDHLKRCSVEDNNALLPKNQDTKTILMDSL